MKSFICGIIVFFMNISFSFGQNFDLNKDGSVNSSDVVLLYNYILNGEEKELTQDDIVGTWKIVFNEYSRYENGVLTETEKENVEEDNNFYIVQTDNKVFFLESSDDNAWHEDGMLIYSIYNGQIFLLGGDFKSFRILSLEADKMIVEYTFEEEKGTVLVLKKNIDTLQRVSKRTDLIPFVRG